MTITNAQTSTRRRVQLLYVGDATLARECLGRPGASIEVTSAPPEGETRLNVIRSNGEPYDILLIEHGRSGIDALAVLADLRARRVPIPAIVVAEWDEQLAAMALRLGASDYVVKDRAAFRALYFRVHRLIAQAAATSAASSRHLDDRDWEDLRGRVSAAEAAREEAERGQRAAVEAIKQTRQDRLADAVAAAKEHAQRESEFARRLAETSAATKALEQQVRDQGALLRLFEERAVRGEQIAATANHRHSEVEAALREEIAGRRSLETQLVGLDEALREAERRRLTDAAAFADQQSRQEAEFNTQLAEMNRIREMLEHRLHETTVAADQVRSDRAAELSKAAEREAALVAELGTRQVEREQLDRRLVDAAAAVRGAEQRVSAAQQAGQQRLNERQAEFHAELSRQHATVDALRHEIAALERVLQESEDRRVSDTASAAARFNHLQSQYDAFIKASEAAHASLQTRFTEVERALLEATERHGAEMADAARRLAATQERAETRLAEATAANRALEQRLRESETERGRDQEEYASLLAEAAAQFADAQETAEQELAAATAATALVESKLREVEVASQHADTQHAAEMAHAFAALEQQQRQTETWLIDAAAVANALEDRLADVGLQLERVRDDAARDREAAFARASEQLANFEGRIAEEIARRQVLQDQLDHVRSALEATVDRHASETAAAAARLADSEERAAARLAQADTAIRVAESKRAEAISALNRVVQQATAERQAASAEAADRQAQFKAALAGEVARRESSERELAAVRSAADDSQRELTDNLAAVEQRARDERAQFERRRADEHAEWERVGLAAAARIKSLTDEVDQARQLLSRAEEQIARVAREHEEERAQSARRHQAADRELAQLRAERDTLQQSLDHTRATADEILTRVTQDRSIERARLEAVVADLETQLREQTERVRASEYSASVRLAAVEDRLNDMRAARDRATASIAQLENQLKMMRVELDAARSRGEVLRATAERVPVLEKELGEVRFETRRQFDQHPASWVRCGRAGDIIHANRAIGRLLGYEPLALQQLEFGAAVFDSASDFRWIVDRCLASLSTQTMETPWKRKDGRRIIIRLIAVPATADSVDLIVEDITHVRELEEKLRNAQRMESVARYGSEVAVTCQGLLNHVKDEGQQWLAGIESDTVRYRGELLLDEVTRATAYLGQLAAYSAEQQNVPELVDVNKVLRDLEPVLKRVAGHNIDVVLPTGSTPLNLDVEARPVERMLVNVAAYGRERMPLGGRLKIDVDSVVVDREFVAKHPHVRPGEHVLLIVNEQRRVVRPDRSARASSEIDSTFSGDSPGVDLGALQALVSECGGHLWMRAEPPGDMELKIHLPRRMLDRSEPPVPAIPSGRSRWIRRAFGARH